MEEIRHAIQIGGGCQPLMDDEVVMRVWQLWRGAGLPRVVPRFGPVG